MFKFLPRDPANVNYLTKHDLNKHGFYITDLSKGILSKESKNLYKFFECDSKSKLAASLECFVYDDINSANIVMPS